MTTGKSEKTKDIRHHRSYIKSYNMLSISPVRILFHQKTPKTTRKHNKKPINPQLKYPKDFSHPKPPPYCTSHINFFEYSILGTLLASISIENKNIIYKGENQPYAMATTKTK
ncbi:hypothetical protein AAV98_18470 [Bacillus sp. CHD6a]|nr:hypothetical protein AAV98_18470 [Bacillus sp. CHD6a]